MTPTPTTTGPGSTSFTVWLVTFLGGVASAIEGIVTPGTPAHTATYGAVGGIVALFATIAKLFHDKGLHVATIQAAGSDIATQLGPNGAVRADLTSAIQFIESDVPAIHGFISDLMARVEAVEQKAAPIVTTDVEAVKGIVHSILTGIAAPAPVPPVTNVVTTEVPPTA